MPPRLSSIDLLKALAIIMMLQGHFIDALLAPEFRNLEMFWYRIWHYCRGFTAPLFFTISGLVLAHSWDDTKYRKITKRGLELILWGYLLKANIFGVLSGHIHPRSWVTDVLHIIGMCILTASLILRLKPFHTSPISQGLISGSIGLCILLIEPLTDQFPIPSCCPLFLTHFINKSNGAVFSIFPWSGYFTIGLSIGFFFKKLDPVIRPYTLLILGTFLILIAPEILSKAYLAHFDLTPSKICIYQDRFIRLGQVFCFIGISLFLDHYAKRLSLFTQIGRSTLNIYIIHSLILYGSFTGFGLCRIFSKSLNPIITCIGACLFVVLTLLLSQTMRFDNIFRVFVLKRIKMIVNFDKRK